MSSDLSQLLSSSGVKEKPFSRISESNNPEGLDFSHILQSTLQLGGKGANFISKEGFEHPLENKRLLNKFSPFRFQESQIQKKTWKKTENEGLKSRSTQPLSASQNDPIRNSKDAKSNNGLKEPDEPKPLSIDKIKLEKNIEDVVHDVNNDKINLEQNSKDVVHDVNDDIQDRTKEKIEALDEKTKSSPKDILESLRNDKELGKFWRSLNDDAALLLLASIVTNSNLSIKDTIDWKIEPKEMQDFKNSLLQKVSIEDSGKSEGGSVKLQTEESPPEEKKSGNSNSNGPNENSKDSKAPQNLQLASNETSSFFEPDNLSENEKNQASASIEKGKATASKGLDLSSLTRPLSQTEGKLDEFGKQTTNNVKITSPRQSAGEQNFNQSQFGSNFNQKIPQGWREVVQTKGSESIKSPSFSEFVERATFLKGSDHERTLTIQLKPDFLGKVDLKLTSLDGVITARVLTDNPLVQDRLEQLLPQIKENLSQQGIDLQRLTVDISLGQPNERNGNFQNNDSWKGKVAKKNSEIDADMGEGEIDALQLLTKRYGNLYPAQIDLTA